MTALPPILGANRWLQLVWLTLIALGHAATMVVAAFTTRDIIGLLRQGAHTIPIDLLAILAGTGLAIFALRSVEAAVAEATGQSYAIAVRRVLFIHMSRTPISVIAERRAGSMALRYVGDLNALKGWVAKGIARLISAMITIPAAFAILYMLEPLLALGAAIPILSVMIGIVWLGAPLGTAHAELRDRRARMAASLAERLPQALALRRSGRQKTELRSLSNQSHSIAQAALYRAWLAETVRALPDVASAIAGAICLWLSVHLQLSVEDAVAALTALALVVWPLRRLADVRDRQKAYKVSISKLSNTLSGPTLEASKKRRPIKTAPALEVAELTLPGSGARVDVTLEQGEHIQLTGPSGSGKSCLLTMAAGLNKVPNGKLKVLGLNPAAVPTGKSLYIGRFSPHLKGSLRRDLTLGIGRTPDDKEIMDALQTADLTSLTDRLDDLSGQVAEDRRNLTSSEVTGIYLMRILLSCPDIAFLDADEVGFAASDLRLALNHLNHCGSACVFVCSQPVNQGNGVRVLQLGATHIAR